MPRPPKKRCVCCIPKNKSFIPADKKAISRVIISVEEYETIRLIDLENYTQQETAAQMKIARTTVQSIYTLARRKLADAIVNGKEVSISGGDYEVCANYKKDCNCGCKKSSVCKD